MTGTGGFAAIWHLAWAVAVSVMVGVLGWRGAITPGPELAALGAIGAAALFAASPRLRAANSPALAPSWPGLAAGAAAAA
jgi:hypothetical protein